MKNLRYLQILIYFLINSILYAASLGGQIINDSRDPNFIFGTKQLVITDVGGTFGTVTLSKAGSFTFPNIVNDGKSHMYSLVLSYSPNNNTFICLTNNKVNGLVFVNNINNLVITCRGQYHISLTVNGLQPGDTYSVVDTYNQKLIFTNNSTQTFSGWYYSTNSYNLKSNISSLNYKRCSGSYNNSGIINSDINIVVNCYTTQFNRIITNTPMTRRFSSNVWKDNNGNGYIFGGFTDGWVALNDLWKYDVTNNTWTQLISNGAFGSPSARASSAVWTDNNNNIYLFGGFAGYIQTLQYNDLWRYSILDNTWTKIKDNGVLGSPSPRFQSVQWNDSLGNGYIYGGRAIGGGLLNDLWKYNISLNTWIQISPQGRSSACQRSQAVSWLDSAGNAYIFGGFSGDYRCNDSASLISNELWKYDILSNVLTRIIANDVPTSPPNRMNTVSWTDGNNNAYIFSGEINGGSTNDLWKYNTISGWNRLNPIGISPQTRKASIAWSDNSGNAYIVGGSYGPFLNISGLLNDLWKYNVTSNSWTQIPGTVVNGREQSTLWKDSVGNVYIFGGKNGSALNDLIVYNISLNTWSKVVVFSVGTPSARYGSISWNDNAGNGYVFGGVNVNTYYNDLWRFDKLSSTWAELAHNNVQPYPDVRAGSASWVDNSGKVYIFGGINTTGNLNDLWQYNPSTSSWNRLIDTNQNGSPSARNGSVAWTDINGNAYIFGGNSSSGVLNDLWQYNPLTSSWNRLIDNNQNGSPSARNGSVAWTDNYGNAYIFGGSNSSGVLNDLWKYNTFTQQWSRVTVSILPNSMTQALAWTDTNGNAYIFGGYDGTNWLYDLYVI